MVQYFTFYISWYTSKIHFQVQTEKHYAARVYLLLVLFDYEDLCLFFQFFSRTVAKYFAQCHYFFQIFSLISCIIIERSMIWIQIYYTPEINSVLKVAKTLSYIFFVERITVTV